MSDRAFLFLFSAFMVLAGLSGMGWLVATGQAASFDGLFLFCSCAVIALSFALYLRWLIRSAMPEGQAFRENGRVTALRKRSQSDAASTTVLQNVQ